MDYILNPHDAHHCELCPIILLPTSAQDQPLIEERGMATHPAAVRQPRTFPPQAPLAGANASTAFAPVNGHEIAPHEGISQRNFNPNWI
jgi:hypothetical protein